MSIPIRILDLDCNLISELDIYESLQWEKSLYGIGIFKIETDYNVSNAGELTINRLIMLGNDPEKVGIIRAIKLDKKGNKESYSVTGYQLKGVFKQRVTIPLAGQATQSWSNKETETILKELVEQTCIDNAANKFDNLVLDTDQARGIKQYVSTRYKNIAEELEKIGRIGEMGYKLYLDFAAKKWNFEVIPVSNKTASVFFSTKFDNIENEVYEENELLMNNYALVGGQGVGAARTIVEVGTASTDVELSVQFVDARDTDDADELENRGEQKNAANAKVINYNCKIINNVFEYEVDWDIGDKVTVQNLQLGINLELVVEKVTEFYMAGKDRQLEVEFGNTALTIKQYVNNNFDKGID
jgi:hypothetical protein